MVPGLQAIMFRVATGQVRLWPSGEAVPEAGGWRGRQLSFVHAATDSQEAGWERVPVIEGGITATRCRQATSVM